MSRINVANFRHPDGTNDNINLTDTGRVGIGTTSPDVALDVVGEAIVGNGTYGVKLTYSAGNTSGIIDTANSADKLEFRLANSEKMRLDAAGNLKFNSGFGSVATAYGVRAWVNFNGTGTVAIRGSGNVGSITDEGTGDYRINFTNAMPDNNYGVAPCSYASTGVSFVVVLRTSSPSGHPMTTGWVAVVSENTTTRLDIEWCCVAVFR